MNSNCKVCEILSGLPTEHASEVNEAILERHVTAEFAASLLTRHISDVGSTTVKKHRAEEHNVS